MDPPSLPALSRAVLQAICSFLAPPTDEADVLLHDTLGVVARTQLGSHAPSAAWAWLDALPPPPSPGVTTRPQSRDVCAAVLTALQGLEGLLQDDGARAEVLGCVLHCLPAVAGAEAGLDKRVAQLARACLAAMHDDAAPRSQAAVAARAHALTDERVLAALHGAATVAQGRSVHKHLELLVKVHALFVLVHWGRWCVVDGAQVGFKNIHLDVFLRFPAFAYPSSRHVL